MISLGLGLRLIPHAKRLLELGAMRPAATDVPDWLAQQDPGAWQLLASELRHMTRIELASLSSSVYHVVRSTVPPTRELQEWFFLACEACWRRATGHGQKLCKKPLTHGKDPG